MALGCISSYTAIIRSKEGIELGELPISSVQWGRVLDEVSDAVIEVPLSGTNCPPCDIVNQIGVWHHELVLFREGTYVWSGPITRLNVTRTKATIAARDLFALMDFRLLHDYHCFATACGGAPADLTVLAEAVINDAFQIDGHGYMISIFSLTQSSLDGGLGERQYTPGEHSWAAMQELLKLGLDATVLGAKIVIGAAPFGSTDTLTSDDFLIDLEFEVNGLAMATQVVTIGDGFIGLANAAGTDVNGESPYYGYLQFEGNDRQELGSQALNDQAAAAILKGKYPAPITLVTPTGAQLNPNAPVTIEELVPGVLIPVIATDLCLEVSGQYVLISLDVAWTQEEGEAVQVTLGTLQSTNSGDGTG